MCDQPPDYRSANISVIYLHGIFSPDYWLSHDSILRDRDQDDAAKGKKPKESTLYQEILFLPEK